MKSSWDMRQLYFSWISKDIKEKVGDDEGKEEKTVSLLSKLPFLLQISELGSIALNYTFTRHFSNENFLGTLWGTQEIQNYNLARGNKEIYDFIKGKDGKNAILNILKCGNKELLSSDLFSQIIHDFWTHYVRFRLLLRWALFLSLLLFLFLVVFVTDKKLKLIFTGN